MVAGSQEPPAPTRKGGPRSDLHVGQANDPALQGNIRQSRPMPTADRQPTATRERDLAPRHPTKHAAASHGSGVAKSSSHSRAGQTSVNKAQMSASASGNCVPEASRAPTPQVNPTRRGRCIILSVTGHKLTRYQANDLLPQIVAVLAAHLTGFPLSCNLPTRPTRVIHPNLLHLPILRVKMTSCNKKQMTSGITKICKYC